MPASPVAAMPNLANIIAQETQDGRLIVRFLLSAMRGDLPAFQPCHRIDAARLLVKLGFDQTQAQAVIDQAAAQRAAAAAANRAPNRRDPYRDSRYLSQAQTRQQQQQSEAAEAARRLRAQLAQIVREETDDGRLAVQFLVNVMQGQLPDFKPGHRLSAAKELLQRGFDYLPDDDDPQEADEPQLTPEERRRIEEIEFSRHGPRYYETRDFPCPCEDRLHDCKGNLLNDEQRQEATCDSPIMQFFIKEPARIKDYLARYANYLTQWNANNPGNPVDINRLNWYEPEWRQLSHPQPIIPTPQPLNPIRGP